MKKLHLSKKNAMIGGVLSGFAQYINKDVTVVRLLYVLITLLSCFAGILFYLICWVVIPVDPSEQKAQAEESDENVFSHDSKDETIVDHLVSQETSDTKNPETETVSRETSEK